MIEKSVGIVLAAGAGKRMHSKISKQYMNISGRPMLYYSLKAFEDSNVDAVVLVVTPGDEEYCLQEIVQKYDMKKIIKICPGGASRYESVYAGLCACPEETYDFVLIHDSARPMVSTELIAEAQNGAKAYGACAIAVPVKDTIKISDDQGYVSKTLKRDELWSIQTPQAFEFDLCLSAYQKLMKNPKMQTGITDDAMVVERMLSKRVKLCMGDYRNIKITTPEDMISAEAYLKE